MVLRHRQAPLIQTLTSIYKIDFAERVWYILNLEGYQYQTIGSDNFDEWVYFSIDGVALRRICD